MTVRASESDYLWILYGDSRAWVGMCPAPHNVAAFGRELGQAFRPVWQPLAVA